MSLIRNLSNIILLLNFQQVAFSKLVFVACYYQGSASKFVSSLEVKNEVAMIE